MNKRTVISLVTLGILLIGRIGSGMSRPPASNTDTAKPTSTTPAATVSAETETPIKPVCDGTTVTKDCALDGINYSTYAYHPAVPEKSHTETVTTYRKEVIGYCTLCNDGTYSPSCSTGRGACSHHGGVQQWNAPEYTNTPVYTTNTVVDAPAAADFYETVPLSP